jgi:hypothetical protein
LQILDPINGEVVWNRVDERVEPDDMFVALEETNGHLFWCTNHGYFGFIPLAASSTEVEIADSFHPIIIPSLTDLVKIVFRYSALMFSRNWKDQSQKQGVTRASLEFLHLGVKT